MLGSVGIPEIVILAVVIVGPLALVVPACRICQRIGHSPWLGLAVLLPLANLVLLWFVAFSRWPADGQERGA